jgi:hypothetical protein
MPGRLAVGRQPLELRNLGSNPSPAAEMSNLKISIVVLYLYDEEKYTNLARIY